MLLQWRKFNFFESTVVSEADKPKVPHVGIKSIDKVCATSGRGNIILGDARGRIHIISRDLIISNWSAHDSIVTHVHQLKTLDVLVSVGDGIDPRSESGNLR